MTKQYRTTPERAAIQLLALDPLTEAQLRQICGWDFAKTVDTIRALKRAGAIVRVKGVNNGEPRLKVAGTVEDAIARLERAERTPHLRRVV